MEAKVSDFPVDETPQETCPTCGTVLSAVTPEVEQVVRDYLHIYHADGKPQESRRYITNEDALELLKLAYKERAVMEGVKKPPYEHEWVPTRTGFQCIGCGATRDN